MASSLLLSLSPDAIHFFLQREAIQGRQRKREKKADAPVENEKRFAEGAFDFGGVSVNGSRIGNSPVFGSANNIEDWVTLAQFVDYDAYRGMFEGQSKSRLGLLIWMSHCAWPSLLWQTYDYFFDPDAGYFGAKKGRNRCTLSGTRGTITWRSLITARETRAA